MANNPNKKAMARKMKKTSFDVVGAMMDWEDGRSDEGKTKELFQHLVNSGQAWHLQGMYGRTANDMLESGFIKKPKNKGKGQKDAYGNDLGNYYNRK